MPDLSVREALIAAAQSVLAQQGAPSSMRAIAARAGCSAGLCYHYFPDKDALMALAAQRMLAPCADSLTHTMAGLTRSPFETAAALLHAVAELARSSAALPRGQLLSLVAPHMTQLARTLEVWGMRPALKGDALSHMLTEGVAASLLAIAPDADEGARARLIAGAERTFALLMGMDASCPELLYPRAVQERDAERCMQLSRAEQRHFPGYEEGAFRASLARAIDRGEALALYAGRRLAGLCLFDTAAREIGYLCIAQAYHGRHAGMRLAVTALSRMKPGEEAQVITFRDDDEHGLAAVSFWRAMGFSGGGDVECFGYPCQRMCLTVQDDPRRDVRIRKR